MKKITWLHLLTAFVVLKIILHLYVNGLWSLHRDALLYLSLGRHLAWGYASVPPFISWVSWFVSNVLGGSVEAVRLLPTLFGTGTVVLTALMAMEFMPKGVGQPSGKFAIIIIGLAGLLSGAYLRPAMLFQPVVFDIFFWTLLSWIFLKYLKTQNSSWIVGFGVATGLGLLNKYTVLIFLFAMLPRLLFKRQRHIFMDKKLWLAMSLALLIFLPNLYWQWDHGFPVVRHMSELATTQFANVTLSGFFVDQLLFHFPVLPIWLGGLYFLLFSKRGEPYRIFGLMYLTVLVVLLFFSAKSYYSIGAYPVLLASGAAFWEQLTMDKMRWLRYAIPAFALFLGILIMPVLLPIFSPEKEARIVQNTVRIPGLQGSLRWEDGKYHTLPQDFADMLGWEEISEAVGKTWQAIPDKSTAAIYADSYGQAGAIEHFGKKYRVPEVICFSDSYRYWLPDSIPSHFQTLIYVNDELGDDMAGFFQKIEKVWELDMPLSRQNGNQVYLCQGPTTAFFERMNKAFLAAKNNGEIED
ncbi:MAG: glycosyltransferase family 39 protein [Saprospiraceae bacterium]